MRVKIEFQPKGKTVSVNKGENILQSALKNRIAIRNRCNGNGTCTTCKVKIATASPLVSLPSAQEMKMLSEQALAEGYRLACQTRVYGPLLVQVPEEAWKSTVKEQMERQRQEKEGI